MFYVQQGGEAAQLIRERREKTCNERGSKFEPKALPLLMMYRWARTDIRKRNFKDAADRLAIIMKQSPGPFDVFVQQQEVYLSMASCKYHLEDYEGIRLVPDWYYV